MTIARQIEERALLRPADGADTMADIVTWDRRAVVNELLARNNAQT